MFRGNDHTLEFNEIHHVCLESNDAGAIYAGRDWTMRGTAIRYNYLHHIVGFRGKGCVGVYLDDMFCGTQIHGNLFHQVTRAAFLGGGRDCTVENNIFIDCRPALHIDARAMNWASYHVATTMTERLKAVGPSGETGVFTSESGLPRRRLDGVGPALSRRYPRSQDRLESTLSVRLDARWPDPSRSKRQRPFPRT